LQQTIFWKSNADKASAAKTDDQASTGTMSSQGRKFTMFSFVVDYWVELTPGRSDCGYCSKTPKAFFYMGMGTPQEC